MLWVNKPFVLSLSVTVCLGLHSVSHKNLVPAVPLGSGEALFRGLTASKVVTTVREMSEIVF